jgi:hypothetical protein
VSQNRRNARQDPLCFQEEGLVGGGGDRNDKDLRCELIRIRRWEMYVLFSVHPRNSLMHDWSRLLLSPIFSGQAVRVHGSNYRFSSSPRMNLLLLGTSLYFDTSQNGTSARSNFWLARDTPGESVLIPVAWSGARVRRALT